MGDGGTGWCGESAVLGLAQGPDLLSWGCDLAWSPRPGEAPSLSPPAPSTRNVSDASFVSHTASSLCSGEVLLGIKWALD